MYQDFARHGRIAEKSRVKGRGTFKKKLTEDFEAAASFFQGSNVKTVYDFGDNNAKHPDAEIDDVHTRNSLASPLYLQSEKQVRARCRLITRKRESLFQRNANLGSEEGALSTQMYYILVMTTAGAALDKCHNAGVNEGFKAWRQFVMEWEPKLRTRNVGLLMNVLGYRFRDDSPTKLAAFERTIHDYEKQSTKTVDDDIKIGVTMLGMEYMRVKEHLIRNSVRITSWNQMREEILEITRTQQYIDSQPKPMQHGANPKSKGKGKAKDVRNASSKKVKNDDRRKCFYCNKTGQVKAECNKRLRDLAEAESSVATSTRRNSDRAITVLTPRRETHVNVCHSHALCEQRNVLRVFQ